MKITTKGQVTIPVGIREKAGLLPHTDVEFVMSGKKVIIQKARNGRSPVRDWIERVRGTRKGGMTTDEIMALTRGND